MTAPTIPAQRAPHGPRSTAIRLVSDSLDHHARNLGRDTGDGRAQAPAAVLVPGIVDDLAARPDVLAGLLGLPAPAPAREMEAIAARLEAIHDGLPPAVGSQVSMIATVLAGLARGVEDRRD